MRKSIIVAMDQKNGIGIQGRIPWRLPTEQQLFKTLTMGHHLIMGRKTFESIGRILPGRVTLVITRNPNFQAKGCLIAHSLNGAYDLAKKRGESEAFICGGSEIYREALKDCNRLYLSRVHAEFQVDTTFPDVDFSVWKEISSDFHPSSEKNSHPFTFFIYERRSKDA